ncbi:MAG: GH116 family glycosyl hydrolase [Fimbriimonas sp.]
MTNDPKPTQVCDCDASEPCGGGIPRRDLLRFAGAAATTVALGKVPTLPGWLVPADPQMTPEWRASLTKRGEREFLRGADLRFIGMPIGGICAGQLYLGGDGQLWLWDVTNEIKLGNVVKTVPYRGESFAAGGGSNYIAPPEQTSPFAQGFAIRIESGGKRTVRTLDKEGWKDVSFAGEYPIGFVEYRDPDSPVSVSLEAFSPFIPLDADDSGLPATIMRYTLRNTGNAPAQIAIGGWMENAVGARTIHPGEAVRRNEWTKEDGASRLDLTLHVPPRETRPARTPIVFEDFEKPTYEGWTVEGTAFGPGPVEYAKQPSYQANMGGKGARGVNTHNTRNGESVEKADNHLGRMLSREFTIERHAMEFFIGGGNHPGKTCLNLLVDGKVVRTATGHNSDTMRLANFNVEEWEGKRARIELLDQEAGGWGQLKLDHIVFTDVPTQVPIDDREDFGSMALALLGSGEDWAVHSLPKEGIADALFAPRVSDEAKVESPIPGRILSGLGRKLTLAPGQSQTVTFVVAWRFPNLTLNRIGKAGNHYATRFDSCGAVVRHIAKNEERLVGLTKRWHETWYDSTLPRWFLDRSMANTSILASMTCVRFGNGRFYGWEGIGCCDGTCGHVWQYAQAVGRLFPSLERSVREMCDYVPGVGFHADSGLIDFRGEYGFGYAADAQAGYILRTYREHQTSKDNGFLRRVWPQAKKAVQFLIEQDMDDDGILEGRQHNTLDVDLYGPSSWLTSLYLAALRSGEEMAKEMGDSAFAAECRRLFDRGAGRFTDLFWNGEYFVQRLIAREHPEALRYGNGCEIDQVMGQGWAYQVGLGRITDPAKTRQALKALYQHNFRTAVGPYRDKYKPGRWYAMPDEAGLLLCTFPQGDRDKMLGPSPTWAHMYFNECWSGCEYEAAGHMIAEGLVEEGLAVMRAAHDRYRPSRRNPYNEVECSDHYARAMASYGAFVAACGFEYHGPKGHLGFAPRLNANDFRAAFTAAEAWGTLAQRIDARGMEAKVQVKHGRLSLKTLALEVPAGMNGAVQTTLNGRSIPAQAARTGNRVVITLRTDATVLEGQELAVRFAK